MEFYSCVICGPGIIREENQDNYYLNGVYRRKPTDASVRRESGAAKDKATYAVADGMGGEASGEVASLISVMALEGIDSADGADVILKRLRDANEAICRFIRDHRNVPSGSTFVGMSVSGNTADIVNIGDSRLYLMRGGEFRQLSCDHTPIRQMLEMGILSEEEARKHPDRHKLSQYLGISPEEFIIEPYTTQIEIKPGDIFLLCSDGLYEMMSRQEMMEILSVSGSLEKKAERLFEAAMELGGKDNITVLLVCVEGESK